MNKIGKDFINGTRYPDFSTFDCILGIPEPPPERPAPEGAAVIKLPSPGRIKIPALSVREAIERWEPVTYFSRSSMTLKDLSFLLWCTQGFRKSSTAENQMRNTPSSGLRYPLETYFVAGEVDGIETGLYRFLPQSHSIVAERPGSDLPFTMGDASLNFKIVTRAAVTFLWVGVPCRSVWALGNRGYRSVLIEAGHTCQALIMAAACIGYQVQPSDLFNDESMLNLANLDPETQWPVYFAAVGKVEREL
ncbi:SagB/ThcOx family dehydrogenase [Methanoregula sp. PtaB.Bin085]|uniref:SagB/ThcOx family dehydrogenase n=1 Tax=Methanoregula sp. PtaB.Bin085 TaxID=1811680 RepID=UPI0009CE86CE|nr:SagB/ThcOx family dehydrogenase [Methanoregula sp. PtaB.Bin085]OPX62319.1 MAG: Nitroreductase family protein [Methanoregula sp. PtaB.Bin085]